MLFEIIQDIILVIIMIFIFFDETLLNINICTSMFLSTFILVAFIVNTRVSQKFCNILVVHEAQFGCSRWFCQGCEGNKPHYTMRCWYSPSVTHQICPNGLEHGLKIHSFKANWPSLIVEVLKTQVKFLEPSTYCDQLHLHF